MFQNRFIGDYLSNTWWETFITNYNIHTNALQFLDVTLVLQDSVYLLKYESIFHCHTLFHTIYIYKSVAMRLIRTLQNSTLLYSI